jgi:MoaA/NifB/PqqE/SkfB family radical SAM enzyme
MHTERSTDPPLVWGYRWSDDAVQGARERRRLLRASIAIPGGNSPNECNLKCIFCFTDGGRRSRSSHALTNDEVVATLKDASAYAYSPDSMNYFFCSEGEPTKNSELPAVLEEVAKLGGTMTIFTNLLEVSDEVMESFGENRNLFVCGKLYSLDPKKGDHLMGMRGNNAGAHKKIMGNIGRLQQLGLAAEGRLGVQCVVTSENAGEILDIFKWGRDNGIVPHIMPFRPQGRGAKTAYLEVSADRLKAIYQLCADYDKATYGYEWIADPPVMAYGKCVIPGNNIYVVTNGDVHICAGLEEVVGNVRTDPMEIIVHHPRMDHFRQNFSICPWLVEVNEKSSQQ